MRSARDVTGSHHDVTVSHFDVTSSIYSQKALLLKKAKEIRRYQTNIKTARGIIFN